MKKRNKDAKRKAFYNDKRDCFLTVDGKYYCYRVWDGDGVHSTVQKFEVGKDLSVELTVLLDESDHCADLGDRYADEHRDNAFDDMVKSYDANPYDGDALSPWDSIPDKKKSPEYVLFAEQEPENPQATTVRNVIDEDCNKAQQDFYYDHFGKQLQLEELRQAEAERTGKLLGQSAMTNRKNAIIDKVAAVLGVERIKRCKHKKG